MADLVGKIAEHGTLGVLLAISFWVIWKLYLANEKLHTDRLTDAQAFRVAQETQATEHRKQQETQAAANLAQSTRMVEACTAAITAQSHVTEGHKQSLQELLEVFKEYVAEVRQSGHSRR